MESVVVDKLIEVLEQEAKIYDNILEISRNKTNIIVEGKVSELENIVKLEQSLVLQMGRLEGLREDLVEKLAGQIGVKASEITVTELVKYLKDGKGDRLKACQENMAGILKQLKDTNEMNAKLIRNSLEYIDFSINLISAAGAVNNNYGSSGQASESKKRNFFDVKL